MWRVLFDVETERDRQESLYGAQHMLRPDQWLGILAREFCEAGNEANECYKGRAQSTAKLRTELVQLAAVAVAWVEALDAAQALPPCEYCDGPWKRDPSGLTHHVCTEAGIAKAEAETAASGATLDSDPIG